MADTRSDPTWFFNYFRQRAANARSLSEARPAVVPSFPGSMAVEQMVLATAGIEALSAHWARIWGHDYHKQSSERLQDFLVQHGDADIWDRVAMPHVIREARRTQEPPRDRSHLSEALARFPGARSSYAVNRPYQSDPRWTDLQSHTASALAKPDDEWWLRRFRYGEFLYREYRCAWVHVLTGPGTQEKIWSDSSRDAPWYHHVATAADDFEPGKVTRVLVFSPEFLMGVFESAIESLHHACEECHLDPYVDIEV